jgi:hypothetical protein
MIVLLVPYRDREENAKVFIEHMLKFFSDTLQGPVVIFITEQVGDRPFNRGALINAGFLEVNKALNDTQGVVYVAHDIDMLPIDPKISYIDISNNTIKHIYGPSHSLGGICSFNKDVFEKINGFPNNYWGWGREDVCLLHRVKSQNVLIDNSLFYKRPSPKHFRELPPNQKRTWSKGDYDEKNRLLQDEIENPEYYKYNGLNTIQYVVKEKNYQSEGGNSIFFQKIYIF